MYVFEDERDLSDDFGSYGAQARHGSKATAHGGEVYEVLWEIGLHLGGFLAIGLTANLLLALFRAV